jgi:hypothetical protein
VDSVRENPVVVSSRDARLEAELEAALRRAPEVHAPRNFQQRLMTRLPEMSTAEERQRRWQLPVLAVLVAVLLGALAVVAVQLGLAGWLAQPYMLLAVLVVESGIALVWLWRTVVSG